MKFTTLEIDSLDRKENDDDRKTKIDWIRFGKVKKQDNNSTAEKVNMIHISS